MWQYFIYFTAATLVLYLFKSPTQQRDARLIDHTPPRIIKRKLLPPIHEKHTPDSCSSSSSDYMELIPKKVTFETQSPPYPVINKGYMLWNGRQVDSDDTNK